MLTKGIDFIDCAASNPLPSKVRTEQKRKELDKRARRHDSSPGHAKPSLMTLLLNLDKLPPHVRLMLAAL
jgi:hypothetical protein